MSSEQKLEETKKNAQEGYTKMGKLLFLANVILVCGVAYLLTIVNKDRNGSEEPKVKVITYSDCEALYRAGYKKNGVYELQPTSDPASRFNVYCDMKKGGWTVIMRRRSDMRDVIFKVKHMYYKVGFGNLEGNHWLGLDHIHMLTATKKRNMMFIIDSDTYEVEGFRVMGPDEHYKLIVMSDIDMMPKNSKFSRLNETYFSTIDVDFDSAPNGDCAEAWDGGWWFTNCFDKSVCMTGRGVHNSVGVSKFTSSVMMIR